MAKTVGDFMIERLHAWGVKRIYGYPGEGIRARSREPIESATCVLGAVVASA